MWRRQRGRHAWAALATSLALARTATCKTAWETAWCGVGVGKGNVGSVIKARTAAWATAWRCVGVGEGNIESVSKNRRRGPFPAAEGATAWATTCHRVGIGEGKGISVRKTGSVGPSLEVAASGGVGVGDLHVC